MAFAHVLHIFSKATKAPWSSFSLEGGGNSCTVSDARLHRFRRLDQTKGVIVSIRPPRNTQPIMQHVPIVRAMTPGGPQPQPPGILPLQGAHPAEWHSRWHLWHNARSIASSGDSIIKDPYGC